MPEERANDHAEFAARYEQVAPALCVWAMRHVSLSLQARVEVDDVLQEIWMRAFRIHDRFAGDLVEFRSWIFGIAKMVLLEVQRSTRRTQWLRFQDGTTSNSDALDQVEASITRLTKRLVREETVVRFMTHLSALPRPDQDLVMYCGLEGSSCADAARKLGIGVEAATKRWQRLRARLREDGIAHDWVA